jgi:ribosomal protein L29
MNKIHKELQHMDVAQLELKLEELRRELFKLGLNAATTHVKSFSSTHRALKRAIACGLTLLQQKR